MQIVMTKRIINRGTYVIELEACPSSSAGALYQKCQEKIMSSLPPETVISIKRGTGTIKAANYPKVKNNPPNWGFITTRRGTARSKR